VQVRGDSQLSNRSLLRLSENVIYAAETADWRVQKLILHPVSD